MVNTPVSRYLVAAIWSFIFLFTAWSQAFSAEVAPFDKTKFEAAQSAGKTVLVHIHAD
jgi:hypothetical protein